MLMQMCAFEFHDDAMIILLATLEKHLSFHDFAKTSVKAKIRMLKSWNLFLCNLHHISYLSSRWHFFLSPMVFNWQPVEVTLVENFAKTSNCRNFLTIQDKWNPKVFLDRSWRVLSSLLQSYFRNSEHKSCQRRKTDFFVNSMTSKPTPKGPTVLQWKIHLHA